MFVDLVITKTIYDEIVPTGYRLSFNLVCNPYCVKMSNKNVWSVCLPDEKGQEGKQKTRYGRLHFDVYCGINLSCINVHMHRYQSQWV